MTLAHSHKQRVAAVPVSEICIGTVGQEKADEDFIAGFGGEVQSSPAVLVAIVD
jgi:hypothetical protein